MANAKDITGEPNPSILIMGDSGTKKTTFLASIPGIWVADFDGGMVTVAGKDVEYDTFKDSPGGAGTVKALKSTGFFARGQAWPSFIEKLNKIGERIDKGERIPVGVDSLTTMATACMNYVLQQAGHNGAPQIQHWGAQIQLMESVMDQLTAWPVPLIVAAHIQRNQNDLTQVVEMLPLVTGKFAGKIGIYFDEVYFAKVSGKGDARKYVFQTESDSMAKQVKSRHNVPNEIDNNWEKVYAAIMKKKAA